MNKLTISILTISVLLPAVFGQKPLRNSQGLKISEPTVREAVRRNPFSSKTKVKKTSAQLINVKAIVTTKEKRMAILSFAQVDKKYFVSEGDSISYIPFSGNKDKGTATFIVKEITGKTVTVTRLGQKQEDLVLQ